MAAPDNLVPAIVAHGDIMKALHSRKTKAELQMLEQHLAAALVPVNPAPEYIKRLKAELKAAPYSPEITSLAPAELGREKMTLIGLAGIFSVLMIMVTGLRTVAAILGAIGLAGEFGKQLRSKKTGTIAPAL